MATEPRTRVLVTGADGFVGRALVRRLLADGLNGSTVDEIVALDIRFEHGAPEGVRQYVGSVDDSALLSEACRDPLTAVFHLASLPGGAAEQDFELGRRINLDATVLLLDLLRTQPSPPRLVFASSIAVYGELAGERVDESTPPAPQLTYGAHKLASEVLIADATRRGWVRGVSLRLPGIVARPGDGAGLISAFMSQLFWKLRAGQPLTVPVSADGTGWWLSVGACVDNLLRGAAIDPEAIGPPCVLIMPALHLSVAQVVDAIGKASGFNAEPLVTYAPDAAVQRLFASYPPLSTPRAEALGLYHDGSAEFLARRATSN